MPVKSKVSGFDGLPQKIIQAAQRGVLMATQELETEVVSLIENTPKSGRIYRRRGVEHQASAPGEPFSSDTGAARRGINTSFSDDRLTGYVNSTIEYGKALEYGTMKMQPRPYMRPALANRSDDIKRIIQSEIEKALK